MNHAAPTAEREFNSIPIPLYFAICNTMPVVHCVIKPQELSNSNEK